MSNLVNLHQRNVDSGDKILFVKNSLKSFVQTGEFWRENFIADLKTNKPDSEADYMEILSSGWKIPSHRTKKFHPGLKRWLTGDGKYRLPEPQTLPTRSCLEVEAEATFLQPLHWPKTWAGAPNTTNDLFNISVHSILFDLLNWTK